MLFQKVSSLVLNVITALIISSFQPAQAQIAGGRYTGLYSGGPSNSFRFELSSDGTQVIEMVAIDLRCPSERHTFILNPGIPVSGGRFSARDVPVPIDPDPGHAHTLDIDGVFFDADGNGTAEQALGSVAFFSALNQCNVRWVATQAASDTDGDGWSNGGEQRLGSGPGTSPFDDGPSSTPEHSVVPTTCLSGPVPCRDGINNDGGFFTDDGLFDENEPDGPDEGIEPDCANPMQLPVCPPITPPPPNVVISNPQNPIRCEASACRPRLTCPPAQDHGIACSNPIELFALVPRRSGTASTDPAARAPRRIRFAFGIANVPPGGTETLRIRLTRAGKKIVRTSKKRRLNGIFEVRNTPGDLIGTTPVKIRLKK